MGAKYHAEATWPGIEYCLSQNKWWFEKNNKGPTKEFIDLSVNSFMHNFFSMNHVHMLSSK